MELGPGDMAPKCLKEFNEKVYRNALNVHFNDLKIASAQLENHTISWKSFNFWIRLQI